MANSGLTLKEFHESVAAIKDLQKTLIMPPSFIADIPRLENPSHSFGALGSIAGMPVIPSEHAYITKSAVRGIADSRRPNTHRPLYRRKTWREGVVFMISQTVFRPRIEPEISEEGFRFVGRMFQESLNKSAIAMITGISGS